MLFRSKIASRPPRKKPPSWQNQVPTRSGKSICLPPFRKTSTPIWKVSAPSHLCWTVWRMNCMAPSTPASGAGRSLRSRRTTCGPSTCSSRRMRKKLKVSSKRNHKAQSRCPARPGSGFFAPGGSPDRILLLTPVCKTKPTAAPGETLGCAAPVFSFGKAPGFSGL